MGGVKGCYQSDEARSEATWSSTMSQTVALFERPLPFAAGDKSQFTTYLVANRYRPGAERSAGLCRCRKTSTKTNIKTNQSGIICFRFE